ncbi:MAG: hypothetical protein HZB82_09930 [Deltaproteobacteria bacterium]|nr:hypothetical protein [Deltaproteobacteria bacterium]
MRTCFSCKRPVDISGKPGRGDACFFCGADLKACLNCAFHDRDAGSECREPMAEPVKDKDRSNFCDYFQFREGTAADSPAADPMEKLRGLFKK